MATIQGVYVALFGRPADPNGLAYFNGVTNNGTDLAAIANLAGQPEYTERFKGQNNAQIVNSIYRSLFNRDAEAAGLNFFVDALNKGTLNINNIAIAILDGAQGDDRLTADNKIKAADAYTAALDTPIEIANYTGKAASDAGAAILAPVTKDAATLPTAKQINDSISGLDVAANAGNNVNVASLATDVTVTSAPADTQPTTAVASDKDDVITIATINADANTAAGNINGGFGTDTVKLSSTAVAAVSSVVNITPEWTSIEKLSVTAKGGDGAAVVGASGSVTVNVSKISGLTEVINDSSKDGALGASAGGAGDVTFNEVALGTKVTLKGGISGDTTVSFKNTAGSSDAATVSFEGAAVTGSTSFAGIETLNISSTGASSVSQLFGAKEINISGTGSFSNIGILNGDTTTVTNTATAAITVNLSEASKIATYTGSTNIDHVTIDTSSLTSNVSINLGAGADTFTLGAGGAAAKTITVSGGEGSDLFYLGSGANVVSNVNVAALAADQTVTQLNNSLVTIADFNKAQDSISFNVDDAIVTDGVVKLSVGQLGQVNQQDDLLLAVKAAASFAGAGKATMFNFGNDAYIYQDNGTAGFNAGDALVKITGVQVADLTADNFAWV